LPKTCAVASVKGGVGKTLVSINIAHKLAEMGHKVGLIDADLDNSNFAVFTKAHGEISIEPGQKFKPYIWDGVQVFSMSLIAGREKGVSMTGDRYIQILDDVLEQSKWDVDYFVVDLPAGSSDVFRVCMELFGDWLVGNVIVTQPILADATRRTLNLHRYLEIPVLGLIENMAYFVCPHHKQPKKFYPFGESTVDILAEEFGVEILGKIPLSEEISKGIANGDPLIKGEGIEAIENACKKFLATPIQKPGFLTRVKETLIGKIKTQVEKILATLLVSAKKEFNIRAIRERKGFTERRPFLLVITDESGLKELTAIPLRVDDDAIRVIKNPKRIDFEIAASFRTLARMILGKRKTKSGQVVEFDPMDAWLMGDVKVYGRGFTPRAVRVFRELFSDEGLMNDIKSKYGKILEKWI